MRLFLYFIHALLFYISYADEGRLDVTFVNNLREKIPVFVFFDDGSDEGYFMNEIPHGMVVEVHTFVGHKFFCKTERKDPEKKCDVNIKFGQSIYYLGGGDVSGKKINRNQPELSRMVISKDGEPCQRILDVAFRDRFHPQIKPLTEVVYNDLTVFAKFRNLSPRDLDFWFEDSSDGLYQGKILTGSQTVSSTFPGHVFYATEIGNKSSEVYR